MGAIPWLGMQLILVAIVIFWPESVTYWLDKAPEVDLNSIKIEIPSFGNQGGNTMPNFGQPGGLPGMPNLGEPPKIGP